MDRVFLPYVQGVSEADYDQSRQEAIDALRSSSGAFIVVTLREGEEILREESVDGAVGLDVPVTVNACFILDPLPAASLMLTSAQILTAEAIRTAALVGATLAIVPPTEEAP